MIDWVSIILVKQTETQISIRKREKDRERWREKGWGVLDDCTQSRAQHFKESDNNLLRFQEEE